MNDRLLGYFILSLLVFILFIPIAFLIRNNLTPKQIRTVEFKNIKSISFVSKQDPVRLQGVQIGVVRDISTRHDKTVMLLELNKSVHFFKGYTITAYLKGLMGDRYISVWQGDLHTQPIHDDAVLNGSFLDGPSEIVGYANQLKSLLLRINKMVSALKDGNDEEKSIVQQFTTFYQKVDTLSATVYNLANDIDQSLNNNRDTIQYIINEVITITDSISKKLPDILFKTKNTLLSTQAVFTQADSFISKTDTFVSGIADAKSILWQNDIKNLQTDLQSLQKTLCDLRIEGLSIPIRLR